MKSRPPRWLRNRLAIFWLGAVVTFLVASLRLHALPEPGGGHEFGPLDPSRVWDQVRRFAWLFVLTAPPLGGAAFLAGATASASASAPKRGWTPSWLTRGRAITWLVGILLVVASQALGRMRPWSERALEPWNISPADFVRGGFLIGVFFVVACPLIWWWTWGMAPADDPPRVHFPHGPPPTS